MADFSDIRDALFAATSALMGGNVTYHRGNSSVEVTATRGRSDFQSVSDGQTVEIQSRTSDFLIKASDLVIGGNVITPAAGDKIRWVEGSITQVYEVTNPPFTQSDTHGYYLRIHAYRVADEVVS